MCIRFIGKCGKLTPMQNLTQQFKASSAALEAHFSALGTEKGLALVREAGGEAVFVAETLNAFCTERPRGSFALP